MQFYYKPMEDGTNCLVSYEGEAAEVIIPDDQKVTILFDDIFKGHTELTAVTIPDSVKVMGGFVFDGCENLKSVELPPHLEDMWQYAMTRSGIETITVPGTVKTIIPFTFSNCKNLKTVTLNEGVTHISAWAFKDCPNLNEVIVPESIVDISEDAFEGCGIVMIHKDGQLENILKEMV
ncbi:MAG: leucine-rich repeat domain-containing protein [Eubacterium sp.]